jgi:hypothetical protein
MRRISTKAKSKVMFRKIFENTANLIIRIWKQTKRWTGFRNNRNDDDSRFISLRSFNYLKNRKIADLGPVETCRAGRANLDVTHLGDEHGGTRPLGCRYLACGRKSLESDARIALSS